MRRSPAENIRVVASAVALAILVAAIAGLRGRSGRTALERGSSTEINRSLVSTLVLTDLALWSEAAYCRHPTQSDSFVAWSDHPGAPEHFPAGSLAPPPAMTFPDSDRNRVVP
jgi:hypothetical protein